ncbi:MAG: crossover junction endodeoxyribonuclease RuvC [Actinomycetota bacterium]
MFVLGIDPGLSVTGYGLVAARGVRLRAVAAGAIRTSPSMENAPRLAELFADLETLLAEYRPDEMALEQVFVNRNLQTATAVGRAVGVALLAAARAGIPVFEYTPSAVKMAVTGSGDAAKDRVQALVARRLGLAAAPRPADAADALAVALCHLQSAGLRRAVAGAGR